MYNILTLHFWSQCNPQYILQDSFWCNPQNCTHCTAYWVVSLLVLTKGSGHKLMIIFYTTMISADMLYAFLQIMEARVYVILRFSLFSCCLNNVMSCTDRKQWPNYNQVSVCHTGVIIVIILITLYFWWQCNPQYCSRVVFLCNPQIVTQITAKWIIFLVLTERSCQIWVILHSSDIA